MIFQDRQDAGEKLAEKLSSYQGREEVVVIGLIRGGVVVASIVAERLGVSLDPMVVVKLQNSCNSELAIGAIANDEVLLDREAIVAMNIENSYLDKEIAEKGAEVKRKRKIFYPQKEQNYRGKVLIIIDDGIATGSTMMATIESLKGQRPKKVILAVPVSSRSALQKFQGVVHEIVCLQAEENMISIGQFYTNFPQVSDSEVLALLSKNQK